ncbi:MAG: hypothetical protein K1X70_09470 [Leptospirales bacterium]|nr:hypothetical protein [Leptospirales bacterium]
MSFYVFVSDSKILAAFSEVIKLRTSHRIIPAQSWSELVALTALRDHREGPAAAIVDLSGGIELEDIQALHDEAGLYLLLLVDRARMSKLVDLANLDRLDVLARPLQDVEVKIRVSALIDHMDMARRATSFEADVKRPETGLPPQEEFSPLLTRSQTLGVLHKEWRRCLRYDRPISCVVVGMKSGASIPPGLHKALAECLHRPGDSLGTSIGCLLAILSETDSAGARHVAQRMHTWIVDNADAKIASLSSDLAFGAAMLKPVSMYRGMRGDSAGSTSGEMLLEQAGIIAFKRACQLENPVFVAEPAS